MFYSCFTLLLLTGCGSSLVMKLYKKNVLKIFIDPDKIQYLYFHVIILIDFFYGSQQDENIIFIYIFKIRGMFFT